ncbi:cholecystokinin receptor-like [Mytilus californianus]|uniref:cholecystokinin receptor-like n=1 Tax=Mytilus californianus TaxID=6549 RepID=UPI0022455351|nr:cholecystokinin receptor-like [Mytilus californianus]
MVFIGCLSVIGVPGNALILVVFNLKHKPSVHRTIILTLATYDFLLCGITLPFEIYDMKNQFTFHSVWVCKIFRTINYFFAFNSGYTLVLMTIDRFRRVCKPMKIQMTISVGRICIFVIFVASAIVTAPNLFIRGIHVIQINANLSGYDCTISDKYINSNVPAIYHGIVLILCMLGIIIVIFLYVWIGHAILVHLRYQKNFKIDRRTSDHSASFVTSTSFTDITDTSTTNITKDRETTPPKRNYRKRSIGNERKEKIDASSFKITKIAITISLFYIVSYIPTLVESILEGIYGEVVMSKYLSIPFMYLIQKAFAINHVVNPIIYGFIDTKFRNDCKVIFFQCFKKCKY